MVGAPTRWAAEEFAGQPDVLAVGFLDLSAAFPFGEVIIHHGGIGTTMAALRAGRPSVVLPHAFDNMFNGRLLHAAGVGACSVPTALTADLESTLASSPLHDSAARIATRLVPTAEAASTIAGQCVDALESRGGR
jgi:UDP:flavonoid glycosyltransferase YjiC (YdhE family)